MIDIDDIEIITNGEIFQYKDILNINQIGKVIIKSNNKQVSEITPLFMTINQNKFNWKDRVKKLIELGADIDMKIDYYGKKKSARDIVAISNQNEF